MDFIYLFCSLNSEDYWDILQNDKELKMIKILFKKLPIPICQYAISSFPSKHLCYYKFTKYSIIAIDIIAIRLK